LRRSAGDGNASWGTDVGQGLDLLRRLDMVVSDYDSVARGKCIAS